MTLLEGGSSDNPRPVEWKIISAGALLTLSGSAILFLVPLYLGAMMESLALTPAQAGVLSGGEYYAIATTSLLGPFWIRRFNWRYLALFGVAMASIGHIGTMSFDNFELIVASRIFAGLFGEGVLYSISFSVLGETRSPDRSFGIAMAVSIVTTSIIIYFSPQLFALLDRNGLVMVLLALAIAMSAVIPWLPTGSTKAIVGNVSRALSESGISRFSSQFIPISGLVALALWFIGPGGFWAFAERMANLQGVSPDRIALGFSLANSIGVIGPLAATALGSRFGRSLPASVATIAMVMIVWLYSGEFSSMEFTVYVILYSAIWSFGSVYFFAFIAAVDWNGKLNVLVPGFQTIGLGGGPLIMGYLVSGADYSAVSWSHALFSIVALIIFVPIALRVVSGDASIVESAEATR